ncbi:MAG: hypothetical protein MSIBF_01605 [Candidatus Altiarchaeales archaeon IMC4]|nr:MAG: hypothetical protein MSIBF_01605 [Candidatus Altiarchaeales archaeon IMC4]
MDYNSPVSGRDIFKALADHDGIVMAANIRIQHSIRGIMEAAKEMDAAVLFEIAKSEVGYTDQQPDEFVRVIKQVAKEVDFDTPYCIHGDHITVSENTSEAIASAENLIKKEIAAGFTSYAIDASHNFDLKACSVRDALADNIEITTCLSRLVPEEYGLEVEVGEIGRIDPNTGQKEITTVEEAVTFIKALNDNGVYPDLLATNNGTEHGNIYDKNGNVIAKVGIDIKRTKDINDAIRPFGVRIAQHGITGTPLEFMDKLITAGILKGNVGTNWQNIALENFPKGLMSRMEKWALDNYAEAARKKNPKISDKEIIGKNIKNAIKPFKQDIANIDKKHKQKIYKASYDSAMGFFEAFNAGGTGKIVRDYIESK